MSDLVTSIGRVRPRGVLAALLVSVPAGAIVWSLVVWSPSLPGELPAQWSGGEVVSRLPTVLFAGTALAIALGAAGFAWHAALRSVAYNQPRRVMLIAGSAAAVSAAAWTISALVVRNPDQEIGAGGLLAILALFYGLLPFALNGSEPGRKRKLAGGDLDVAATERLAWSETVNSRLFGWCAAVALVVSVGAGYVPLLLVGAHPANLSVAIALSALALVFLVFTRVRVTADERGLRAVSTTAGIRLVAVPLDQILDVQATDLEPLEWGGWGYRLRPRGRALILRAGSGLVLTLRGDREVAVSAPHAAQAARVLRALHKRDTSPFGDPQKETE